MGNFEERVKRLKHKVIYLVDAYAAAAALTECDLPVEVRKILQNCMNDATQAIERELVTDLLTIFSAWKKREHADTADNTGS